MSIIVETEELRAAVTGVRAGQSYASHVLDAVIPIIERDYIVQPRCPENLGTPDLRCGLPAGHGGNQHRAKLANGSEITFENLVDNLTDVG